MNNTEEMHKRGPVVSGRLPQALFDEAKKLIGTEEFRTMNDVVEEAIQELIDARKNKNRTVGGMSLGN